MKLPSEYKRKSLYSAVTGLGVGIVQEILSEETGLFTSFRLRKIDSNYRVMFILKGVTIITTFSQFDRMNKVVRSIKLYVIAIKTDLDTCLQTLESNQFIVTDSYLTKPSKTMKKLLINLDANMNNNTLDYLPKIKPYLAQIIKYQYRLTNLIGKCKDLIPAKYEGKVYFAEKEDRIYQLRDSNLNPIYGKETVQRLRTKLKLAEILEDKKIVIRWDEDR